MRYKKYKDIVAKTKTPIALNIPAAIIFEFTIIFFEDKDKKNSLTSSEFYILKTGKFYIPKPALAPPETNRADILDF